MSSTYKNHVILRGLDEARAHQRGLETGRAPKKHEVPQERTEVVIPPKVERNGEVGAPKQYEDATRLAIAMAPGSYVEVMKQFGVTEKYVNRMRALYSRGELMVDGIVVEPDLDLIAARKKRASTRRVVASGADRKKPANLGRAHPTDAERRAIALQGGTDHEVAERNNVSKPSVARWRKLVEEGKL